MKILHFFFILCKKAITALCIALAVCISSGVITGCGKKRQAYSSPDYRKVMSVRLMFKAGKFSEALPELEKLAVLPDASGDVLYYYAHCLQRERNDTVRAAEYYQKAIKWFDIYASEFPEDENYEKAFYNLGIIYYKGSTADLQKTKKIWDLGLKRNSKNSNIKKHYANLLTVLVFSENRDMIKEFMNALNSASDKNEIKKIQNQYSEKIKKIDTAVLKNIRDNNIAGIGSEEIDLVSDVILRFDDLIKLRMEELQ